MSGTKWDVVKENWLILAIIVTLLAVGALVATSLLANYIEPGFSGKTLWDWMEVVGVPVTAVIIAGLFAIAAQRSHRRADSERELALEQARDASLKEYLSHMSDLILNHQLQEAQENSPVRAVAVARTLTVLRGLDGPRKGTLIQFLHDAKLISIGASVVSLDLADLTSSTLSRANLEGSDLSGANLGDADFYDANLRNVNLRSSVVTNEELMKARDLIGAIMPDGSKMTEDNWEEFKAN